jgi:branched-chain amino acid transport system substrate-binding protein
MGARGDDWRLRCAGVDVHADTVPFWAAGLENLSGHWQSLWYHGLTLPAAQAFTKRYAAKFGGPPDNQAWGDYVGVRIVVQSIAETKATNAAALIQHLEKGASFDILKERKGVFRAWDHQLLQEMYVVKVKDKTQSKDKWDIFDIVRPVPGPKDSFETIQPTQAENPCKMT